MTNTTINAVAEAMHRAEKNRDAEPAYWTTECTGSHVYLNMAKAAIKAYETAQRSDKEACHSKSADSESQTVGEMTVEGVALVIKARAWFVKCAESFEAGYQAAIEAYEKASVKEMTVDDVYSVIYESLLLDPRGCADNLETDTKIITDALAKLGTIRIVGGGDVQ